MAIAPVVVVEVGTSKVCALVGEALEDDHVMIVGIGECPSRGVRKGEVIDIDNVISCLNHVLEIAEEQAKVSIFEVYLVISGEHIHSLINRGNIPIQSEGGVITEDDLDEVKELARAVRISPDREILHSIPQNYYLDDQYSAVNPNGMVGSKLALDMLILHCLRNRIRNAVRTLKAVNVEVKDVAFGGLMSPLAVLTPEQKESGVILIDLGGGTTDYSVYANMTIADAGTLAVGGDHVTNDIALGLGIPVAQAEQLKISSGSAIIREAASDQSLSLPPEGGFQGKIVKLDDLHTIMHARMHETLNLVKQQVMNQRSLLDVVAGVVLTGGGAHMEGIIQLAEEVFDRPCHVGRPRNINGLAIVTDGPQYAAPLGMLQHVIRTKKRRKNKPLIGGILRTLFGS